MANRHPAPVLTASEAAGYAAPVLTASEAAGYAAPVLTASECASLHALGENIDVVIDGSKRHRNMFERMCDAFRWVRIPHYSLKRSNGPSGT